MIPVSVITEGMATLGSVLPAGKLKDFLTNPIGAITGLLAGKVFQTGQYRLGERFIRHILSQPITGYRDVPDEAVPAAQMFFTMALGVDINNDEDLQALDSGVDAYLMRPDKQSIPVDAVKRAVAIKKYWPMTKDGQWFIPWPVSIIYKIESDPLTMSYHSNLINKDLPVAMKTAEGDSNIKGQDETPGSTLKKPSTWIWIIVIVIVIAGIIYFVKRKK